MTNSITNILAISGSLRATSANSILVRNIAQTIPSNVNFTIYQGLAAIPAFDDSDNVPAAVEDFRSQLSRADGVLICTPEYAFGVPGALKNALDWTVSSGELVNKPLALITASTGGEKAHAAFLLIFKALSARIAAETSLHIPFIRTKLNQAGDIIDPAISQAIKSLLEALVKISHEE